MWITRYEQWTGRILGSEYHSSPDIHTMEPCILRGYYNPECFYYDCTAKKIIERPQMEIKTSGNTLTGLPLPCTVKVRRDPRRYFVEDGEFAYETPLSGKYEVLVCAFPYIDWKGVFYIEDKT